MNLIKSAGKTVSKSQAWIIFILLRFKNNILNKNKFHNKIFIKFFAPDPKSEALLKKIVRSLYNLTHPNDAGVDYHFYVVDVKMAGQNFTGLTSCFQSCYGIEQFEYVGTAPLLSWKKSGINAVIISLNEAVEPEALTAAKALS